MKQLFLKKSQCEPKCDLKCEQKKKRTLGAKQSRCDRDHLATMTTTVLDAVAPNPPVRLECDEVLGPGSLDDEPCVVGPKTEQPVKRKRSASASPAAEPEPKVACVKDGEEDGANPSPPPNPPGITKHVDKPTDPRKQAQQAVAKPNRRGQVSPVLRVCRVTGSETWFVLRDLCACASTTP